MNQSELENLDPGDPVYHVIGEEGAQHTDTTSPIPSYYEVHYSEGEEEE